MQATKRRQRIGIACLLTGAMGTAWGAGLLDVYHLAQQNDPTLEAARYTYEAAQEKLPQARAGLLPVLAVNGNGSQARAALDFNKDPTISRGARSWAWTAQLTQPLIRIGNLYAYGEAEGIVAQAAAQYRLAEQTLILRVAQAYFDVLEAQESIATADAQFKAMGEQLAQAEHGFKAGTSTITDVHEAQSHADSARAQRLAAQNDLAAKRAELEKIIGPIPDPLAGLRAGAGMTPPKPDNVEQWRDQARHDNPAVQAQEAALATAESTIKKNRADHLPTVDLVGSYGANRSSAAIANPVDFSDRTRTRQIGVQVTIPIFSGGAVNSRVKEALANKFKARAELEAAQRQAATDAQVAYAGIQNGLAQIAALDSAVVSGKSAVKGNEIGYKVGIRINLDVLNSQQQLATAKRDLAKARYDTLLQGLKLKAAAGVLGQEDMVEMDRLF